MFKAKSYVGHKICRPGDLVINTMWAWAGALGISKQIGIVSPSYAVYRPTTGEFIGDYLELLLRTRPYTSNYLANSTGVRASRLRLYPEEFFNIPVVIPRIDEQQQILNSIAERSAPIDLAVGRTLREIELMQEYRTRLIVDVVTGKLDTRRIAAALPTEVVEVDETTTADVNGVDLDPEEIDE